MSRTSQEADLAQWDPEDDAHWDKRLEWRTLWITTFSLFLAFASWYVVSAIAPKLTSIGFNLDKTQLYWLTALPGLSAGILRLVYMFLPPMVGTRNLIGWSSLLLALPLVGWTLVVQDNQTPYWLMLVLSFSSGIGGGVFSGYMASTSYFFPKRMQGTAMGLQAGIGNFGIGVMQLLVPWVVGFGLLGTWFMLPQTTKPNDYVWLHNGGLVLIPWCIIAAVLAFKYLRRVPVKANFKEQLDIFKFKHTWVMTAIYLMTFGIYSGFAAQMGLLIGNIYGGFENAPNPLTFMWIGPAIGAAARAALGPVCDRFGGAPITLLSGIGMTAGAIITLCFLNPTSVDEFWGFLAGMIIIFLFAGFGNAGTFKQIPMIFPKRQAGGVVGFTSAIAAFGPFLVGVGLAMTAPTPFFIGCAIFFFICTVFTWWYYARPNAEAKS